jgi:hypothetical protein
LPDAYYQTPAFVYRDSASFVVVYSVADAKKPSLIGAHTYDGWMGESRIVDGKLVFVSTRNVNRNPVYSAVNDMVYKNTTKKVDVNQFQVKATDILPQWTTLKQTAIKIRNGKTKLSVQKTVMPVDCTQFLYRKQQKLTATQYGRMAYPGETMTSIVSLPLTAGAKPTIKIVYGPSMGAVHVTKDSIYTVGSTYFPMQFSCPALPNVSCMPWR